MGKWDDDIPLQPRGTVQPTTVAALLRALRLTGASDSEKAAAIAEWLKSNQPSTTIACAAMGMPRWPAARLLPDRTHRANSPVELIDSGRGPCSGTAPPTPTLPRPAQSRTARTAASQPPRRRPVLRVPNTSVAIITPSLSASQRCWPLDAVATGCQPLSS